MGHELRVKETDGRVIVEYHDEISVIELDEDGFFGEVTLADGHTQKVVDLAMGFAELRKNNELDDN